VCTITLRIQVSSRSRIGCPMKLISPIHSGRPARGASSVVTL
jgi:hypothetical protein